MDRLLTLLLSSLYLAGCSQAIPEEKQAEFLEAIDEIARSEEAKEAVRAAAVEEFVARPKIPTSTCEDIVVLDRNGEPTSNGKFPSPKGNNYQTGSLEDLDEMPGSRIARFRESAAMLRSRITGEALKPFTKKSIDHVARRIQELADNDGYRYDIHYLVRKIEHHEFQGEMIPVHVEGRAFVWDYDKSEIICAADAQGLLRDGDTLRVRYDRDRGGPTEKDEMTAYKYQLTSKVRRMALRKMGIGLNVDDEYDYTNVE
jgi:hypothetical protein